MNHLREMAQDLIGRAGRFRDGVGNHLPSATLILFRANHATTPINALMSIKSEEND